MSNDPKKWRRRSTSGERLPRYAWSFPHVGERIRACDAGAALRRYLVAGGDVDDVDGKIGKLRRECRREIVAAGFDQHQIERRESVPHVGDGRKIGRSVLAERG